MTPLAKIDPCQELFFEMCGGYAAPYPLWGIWGVCFYKGGVLRNTLKVFIKDFLKSFYKIFAPLDIFSLAHRGCRLV
jgi:hypothetical protein